MSLSDLLNSSDSPTVVGYPRVYRLTSGLRIFLIAAGTAMTATACLYLADLAIIVAAGALMLSSLAAAILLMGVFAGSATLGIYWVLAGLRTKLILHVDAIEAQGGVRRRR